MTKQELIQLVTSLIGSMGFGILFNIRGKRLAAAAAGGLFSWGLFLALSRLIASEAVNYFIVAAVIALYAEIMARVLKTPAAPIATTALVPLIPGGSLYYTMASAFESDPAGFLARAVSTLRLAGVLALGVIIVAAISKVVFRPRAQSTRK